uniref:Swi5-dependent recombination DNA repair protein 1 homolog n=1 Tax=Spermophilus dauricus TaxID=99837 RepID=A0A8C9QJX5_SPEDA
MFSEVHPPQSAPFCRSPGEAERHSRCCHRGKQVRTSLQEAERDSLNTDKIHTPQASPQSPTSFNKPEINQEDGAGDTNKDAEESKVLISTMQSSPDKARTPQDSVDPPSPDVDSSQKEPTSATLKDKVKKTRISSNSCSVIKRLKVEKKENDQNFSEKPASSTVENSLESQSSKHKGSESEENAQLKNTVKNVSACKSETVDSVIEKPKQGLNEEKALLVKQVRDKEELLRRLKLVKMYRSKNNLSQLEILISKWRNCSQLLLYELQSLMSEEKKITLTQLIDLYGLDDTLLHFNRSEEEFAGNRAETLRLLEGRVGTDLYHIGLGTEYLGKTQRVKEIRSKINKWDGLKL